MDIGHHHPYYPDPDILAIEDLLDFSNEEDISTNHHNHNHNSPIEQTPLLTFTNPISSSSSSSSSSSCSSCSCSIISSSSLPHNPSLHQTPPPILEKKLSLAAFDASFVPCDESAELEWLSNFVEESFSSSCGQSAHNSGTDCPGTLRSFGDEASGQMSAQSSFLGDEMSGQMPSRRRGRPRTKRHRTTPACFWNSRILSEDASESIILESSYSTTTSTTTNTTITATSSDSDMFSTYYDHDDDDDNDEAEDDDNEEEDDDMRPCERVFKPSSNVNCREGKKFRKLEEPDRRGKITKPSKLEKAKAQDEAAVRKCLHCATQKTPQWRAGPMGPKTLCNACGVRYKSGRLCPEYRPSASPTFNENVHSNSHRRVIEMRRQKGELIDPNSRGPARERLERASNVHD